jgi:Ni/Fe-hydrogenase 1 B-type cytochrome subunit
MATHLMHHPPGEVALGDGPDLQYGRKYVWEFPVRLTHWVDAFAFVVLLVTGLLIARPQLVPVGEAYQNFWMGRIREIHFIFAFAFTFGFLVRIYWFFAGNNYARSGFPFVWRGSWWKAVFRQLAEYMHVDRAAAHLGHNALAGLSYTVFILLGLFEILTGFALYSEVNPGGFWDKLTGWVIPLMGGAFQVHMWHHLAAWGIVIFVIFHLYIVIYDSSWYRDGLVDGMLSGFKFFEKGDLDNDKWIS